MRYLISSLHSFSEVAASGATLHRVLDLTDDISVGNVTQGAVVEALLLRSSELTGTEIVDAVTEARLEHVVHKLEAHLKLHLLLAGGATTH